jgi:hypothetical protein
MNNDINSKSSQRLKEMRIKFGKFSLINLDQLKYGKTVLETARAGPLCERPNEYLKFLSSIVKDKKHQYCTVGYNSTTNLFGFQHCEFYVYKVNPIDVYDLIQKQFDHNKQYQEFELNINNNDYYFFDTYYDIITDYFNLMKPIVRVSVRDRSLSDNTHQITIEVLRENESQGDVRLN